MPLIADVPEEQFAHVIEQRLGLASVLAQPKGLEESADFVR
jgi:hypothetical protein